MINNTIYLDNAATTFPKPEKVYQVMDYVNRNMAVNAGRGSYELAREAAKIIDETRVQLLKLCSSKDVEVIFSSSATVAINQILRGMLWNKNDVVYVTPYEHNAVMRTLHSLGKEYEIIIEQIPIDAITLEIDLEKTKYLFTQRRPKMICITHVSNVTGYILPIIELAGLAKTFDSITLIDGAQALGLVPFILDERIIDFYVFAGHKTLYGPFGIAGFYYNKKYKLKDYFTGGTGSDSLNLDMPIESPIKYEPSSPNIGAIAGLNAALSVILDEESNLFLIEKEKTKLLIDELQKLKDIVLYLPNNLDMHVGIISFNIQGYNSNEVGMILNQDFNISARTGYHCTPLIHSYLNNSEYSGTIRISIGKFTKEEHIMILINALKELID